MFVIELMYENNEQINTDQAFVYFILEILQN